MCDFHSDDVGQYLISDSFSLVKTKEEGIANSEV